jgi:BirA family biotin operon repressor/biotin-[acetyl-CoA-carboxylase] ligase
MKREDAVLACLREKQNRFVSGEDMAGRLKVTRAAVWKEITALRKLGYGITSEIGRGYKLTRIPDKMFADEIIQGLKNRIIGRELFCYGEVDSTNDVAHRLGESGTKEGTCVFAEHQKKGRGRLGRSWEAPKSKNVLLSVLLRPLLPPTEVPRLTLAVSIAVARTIERETGVRPGIKWPNDVLIGEKKVCGILTEMSAEVDRVKYVVIGIGVNANTVAKDLPDGATSLREVTGKNIHRPAFARTLLVELETEYTRLKEGRYEAIAKEWEEYTVTSGRRVTATISGRKIQGQAVGIDLDGALWIRRDNGLQERVTAGDIQHLR